jgi:predicted membrane protein
LKTQGSHTFVSTGPGIQYTWDLSFNPDTRLDLETDIGVGDVNLDLSALAIDDVKVDFGIGEVTIDLPSTGEFDIDVDGGIGSIVIKVPEGMSVRLRTDVAIVGRNIPASYSRNDNIYTSPDYSDAENRANITLGLGIGSVAIHEIHE